MSNYDELQKRHENFMSAYRKLKDAHIKLTSDSKRKSNELKRLKLMYNESIIHYNNTIDEILNSFTTIKDLNPEQACLILKLKKEMRDKIK